MDNTAAPLQGTCKCAQASLACTAICPVLPRCGLVRIQQEITIIKVMPSNMTALCTNLAYLDYSISDEDNTKKYMW